MSAKPATKAAETFAEVAPAAPVVSRPMPETMLVLDTTAQPGEPPRVHQQSVDGLLKSYSFEAGKPLELPPAIAAKFLQHDAFRLVDADNNVIPYIRPPRQPDQLQAGEKLVLGNDEVVARLDELTNPALLRRVLPMPGGERFNTDKPDRAGMIAFIMETKAKLAKANKSKEPDVGKDDFVPEAEIDE